MKNSWLATLLVYALCVVLPTCANDLCLVGQFEQQADALLQYIRLTDEQLRTHKHATSDINHVLQSHWPGCKIMPYGSTVTGLALKSSDIDCYVEMPDNFKGDNKTLVTDMLNILKNYTGLFREFEIRPTARVPLLSCMHGPTHIFVDLTFSDSFAVNSSLLLSYFLHLDQRALDLAIIIKYWGSVHNISNGKLTLPSYTIVLMAVFYLQQKNILPPVTALQENVTTYEVDHWNTAFEPIEYHTENNETLYELLGGFFKYYSDFNFEDNIISAYVGYPIKRARFENINNLSNFSLYKRNVANGVVEQFHFGHLNIQDTFKHSQNTGRPRSDIWLADRLIKQVRASARMYDVLSRERFLTALLVPEKRLEAGVLKTFWSGGIGSPEDCRRTIDKKIT